MVSFSVFRICTMSHICQMVAQTIPVVRDFIPDEVPAEAHLSLTVRICQDV